MAGDLITVVYIIGRKLQNNTTYYWKRAFYGGIFLPFNRLLVCYIPQRSSRVQLIHELCQGTTPNSAHESLQYVFVLLCPHAFVILQYVWKFVCT